MAATLCNRRYARSALASNGRACYLRDHRFWVNLIDGGDGQFVNPIGAPITLDGLPYRTRLRVSEERTGRLVREVWSADDGTWRVTYLNRRQQYLVVCYDATYPALAYDHQTPDPM
jgi:hypothetical protein